MMTPLQIVYVSLVATSLLGMLWVTFKVMKYSKKLALWTALWALSLAATAQGLGSSLERLPYAEKHCEKAVLKFKPNTPQSTIADIKSALESEAHCPTKIYLK